MNDLTQLMERTTDDLRPNVADLVSGGMSRGRRLRTRRRAATGLGAVAAAAAVAATAMFAPSFVGDQPASHTSVATQPKQDARPAGLPSLEALRAGRVVTMPPNSELITSWGSKEEGFVAASWKVVPADGSGAGEVSVLVEYAVSRLGPVHGATGAPTGGTSVAALLEESACGQDRGHCTQLPDGSWLSTITTPEPLPGGAESEIVGAHADLWISNGLHVSATAYNAMGEKDTPVTRTTPVLRAAQLAAMVQAANLS